MIQTKSESGGIDAKATLIRVRPYIDVTLETPLYTVGLGYVLREERTKATGMASPALFNEEYNGLLGWRPDRLPSLEARWKRTDLYDGQRLLRDVSESTLSLVSRYHFNGFQLHYSGVFSRIQDDRNHLEQKQLYHSAKGVYGGSFWDGRIAISTAYDINNHEVKTFSEGKGFFTLPA